MVALFRMVGAVSAVAGLAISIDGITTYPSAPFNLMTGAAAVLMVAVIRPAMSTL